MGKMRINKKSIYYSLAFLGFTGMISTAILAVTRSKPNGVQICNLLTTNRLL